MAVVRKTISMTSQPNGVALANNRMNNTEYPEELQFLLEDLLGNKNVYYQPPEDKQLEYPCIVYQLDGVKSTYGDNYPYLNHKRYLVTYIDRSPDMYIPDKIAQLRTASFNRFFKQDNLNHWAYRIYFDAHPNN